MCNCKKACVIESKSLCVFRTAAEWRNICVNFCVWACTDVWGQDTRRFVTVCTLSQHMKSTRICLVRQFCYFQNSAHQDVTIWRESKHSVLCMTGQAILTNLPHDLGSCHKQGHWLVYRWCRCFMEGWLSLKRLSHGRECHLLTHDEETFVWDNSVKGQSYGKNLQRYFCHMQDILGANVTMTAVLVCTIA